MPLKRMFVFFGALLVTGMAFGQRVEPGSSLTLRCKTFKVPSGEPSPGLPVFISTGVMNGSMSHYHMDFGRPKPTPYPASGNSGADATFEFTSYMPEIAGTYTYYCSIPGFTSYTEIQSGTNMNMSPLLYLPSRVKRPDADCKHSPDCYVAYVNRTVLNGVMGILLTMQTAFPEAQFKAKRIGTKDGGVYDSGLPWFAPGGDKHDKGDEVDIEILEGANINDVAAELTASGCQVTVLNYNTLHVKFPTIGMRILRPKGH